MLTNAQDPQGQVQRRQGQVPIQVEVEKKHLQPQEGLMNEEQQHTTPPCCAVFCAQPTQRLDDYDTYAPA
jgi:hypothetical protein